MLFMPFPYRDEKELLSSILPIYSAKLAESGVIEVVSQNYFLVEPSAAIADDAFERISSHIDNNIDLYGQQKNDEVNDDRIEYSDNSTTETLETTEAQSADLGNTYSLTNQVRVFPHNVINENKINMQQREVFNFVHKWSRNYIKSLGCKTRQKIKLLYMFITGGAGVGKSHLIKNSHMSLSKALMYKGGDPEKPRILLLAPTGVAAMNINGTIHSGLGINVGSKLYPLSDRQGVALRNKFSEVRLVIVNEMFSCLRFVEEFQMVELTEVM